MQTLAASCPGVAAGLLRRPRLEQQLRLRSIGGLIDHHRPPVRPVWPTRVDPAVRLHRWRGSGDPGEIRAHDLAFTDPETAELFTLQGFSRTRPSVMPCRRWSAGPPPPGAGLFSDRDQVTAYTRTRVEPRETP